MESCTVCKSARLSSLEIARSLYLQQLLMTKQNYQLLNWSLLTEEIFQVHSENWLVANLLVVDFFSQP